MSTRDRVLMIVGLFLLSQILLWLIIIELTLAGRPV